MAAGHKDEAIQYLEASFRDEKPESVFMKKWLVRALEVEDFPRHRISPFGLTKKDIIFYLPVKNFVRRAKSWDQLIEQHQSEMESGAFREPRLKYFKTWLATRRGGKEITDDDIRAAVAAMDEVPGDFLRLADECDLVAAGTLTRK